MRRTRRFALLSVLLTTLALVAVSCGGSETADTSADTSDVEDNVTTTTAAPSADSTTTTTAALAPLTASFRGVSEDTIKVGVVSFDWETLADLGVNFGRNNAEDLYIAAIEEINDRGGVHGRLLEPVSRVFLPVGPTDADRVCLELTEDNEIFVVIGTTLNDQILCFTEQHQTAAVVANGMTPSTIERADAPYAAVIDAVDRRMEAFVDIMTEHGALDDATVGVLGAVDVSPESYHAAFAALTDAGFDPVAGLIGGNAEDLEASAREQEVIAELMREAGVNVTVSTSGVPLVMANMRRAGYESEQWLLSTLMTGRGLAEEGIPFDYLDGALSAAHTLMGSTEQPAMADDPLIAACVDDLVERTGHELHYSLDVETNDMAEALLVCAMADILEAGLLNAGPVLTNDSFQAGLEAIGEIDIAGYIGTSLSPGDMGAAKELHLMEFDGDTGVWNRIS